MRLALPVLIALAGCEAAPVNNAAAVPTNEVVDVEEVPADEGPVPATATAGADALIGRWTGPEGLVLDVQPGTEPGGYRVAVTLLDGTNSYDATSEGDTLRFTRDGVEETIRRGTGDETGLKYLAGKQDCVVIKSGEGFCRG